MLKCYKSWFTGYRKLEVSSGQQAFPAIPEKSLLDLIYLIPGGPAQEVPAGLPVEMVVAGRAFNRIRFRAVS